jgi:hypothetical protein
LTTDRRPALRGLSKYKTPIFGRLRPYAIHYLIVLQSSVTSITRLQRLEPTVTITSITSSATTDSSEFELR